MQYLIYITIFLIPFYFIRFSIFDKIPTNVFEVAVLITFLVTLVLALIRRKFNSNGYLPYFLIVTAGASIILSQDMISALGIFKGWFLIPLLLYLSIINAFSEEDLPKISIPLLFSVVIVSAWAVLQKYGIITTLFYQRGDASFNQYLIEHSRVFGPFESPNYLAMFIVPAALLTIPVFSLIHNKIVKVFLALIYLLPLAALLLSGSRGGVIGLVLAVLIYLFVSKKDKFFNSTIISGGFAIAVFLAIALAAYKFGFDPKSDSIRIEIYKYSLQMLKSNWHFGIGLGDFYTNISAINPMADSFRTFALPYALHPHNIFLAFWLNLGLAGFLVFVGLLISFFWRMHKYQSKSLLWAGALMAMIAILAHGLFDSTYWKNDLSALFWLTMAVSYMIVQRPISGQMTKSETIPVSAKASVWARPSRDRRAEVGNQKKLLND